MTVTSGFIPDHLSIAIAANAIKAGNIAEARRALKSVMNGDNISFAVSKASADGDKDLARQLMRFVPKGAKNRLWVPGAKSLVLPKRFAKTTDGTREVADAHNKETDGDVVRRENDGPVSDATVNTVFDNHGFVRKFLKEFHSWNSIDGKGMPILGTVHYGEDFGNAFWNSIRMTYGDGNAFMVALIMLSVCIHEFMHGCTEKRTKNGLRYQGQSGAGNESESDCGACAGESMLMNLSALAYHWLIAKGIWKDGPGLRKALRCMLDDVAYDIPGLGKDKQPKHMKDYVQGWDDNGKVHTNSGIPNYAYALCARALEEDGQGNTWATTIGVIEKIRWAALPHLPETASFAQVAYWRIQACSIFPDREAYLRNLLSKVYDKVGIKPDQFATDDLTPSPEEFSNPALLRV
jgi:Zn-dependent metalloprotease